MKLIIEIPDHIYEHAKNGSEDSYDEWDAMRAIANGLPYEQRPHGEWLELILSTECSVCHKRFEYLPYDYRNFCPNCGSPMISLNSEIENSKSEIVPDYRDGWRLKEGEKNEIH